MSLPPRVHRSAGRHRTAFLLPAALLALVIGLAGCATGAQTGPGSGDTNYISGTIGTTVFKPGQRPVAPGISGPTLTGQRLSLSSYHGDVVVLNFWASWCGPCRSEAPVLAQLSRMYQAQAVRFIGVNLRDPGQANGEAYERSFGISYPSLYDPTGQVLLAFRQTVPPSAVPSTLVIDQTGHIAARTIGPVNYTGLKTVLGMLASGKPAAGSSA